jgi:hypothetical protein
VGVLLVFAAWSAGWEASPRGLLLPFCCPGCDFYSVGECTVQPAWCLGSIVQHTGWQAGQGTKELLGGVGAPGWVGMGGRGLLYKYMHACLLEPASLLLSNPAKCWPGPTAPPPAPPGKTAIRP